jgi:hypothetical protein
MLEMRDEHSTGLPFACLITKLIIESGIDISAKPVMRIQDSLGSQTLVKSNAPTEVRMVKAKLISLLQLRMISIQQLPLLRLLLSLLIMTLDMLRY